MASVFEDPSLEYLLRLWKMVASAAAAITLPPFRAMVVTMASGVVSSITKQGGGQWGQKVQLVEQGGKLLAIAGCFCFLNLRVDELGL